MEHKESGGNRESKETDTVLRMTGSPHSTICL